MRKYLISADQNSYKANLHSHTNISDGAHSPEALKELYKSHGYSVLAYTDHDIFIPHNELTDDEFVALSGFEAHFNKNNSQPGLANEKTCHICFIAGKSDIVEQPCWNEEYAFVGNCKKHHARVIPDKENSPYESEYSPEGINKMIEIVRSKGFFATYNHPCWSLENYNQYMKYENLNAIEVYNYATELLGYQSTATYAFDDILRSGKKIFAVAADDVHGDEHFGGFVMIQADELKYELITEALFNGRFYASTGPLFKEVYVEDGKLHVKTSDVASISMTTDTRKTKCVYSKNGEAINEAVFQLDFGYKYFRISIKDFSRNYAYTNAFFPDEAQAD